MKHRASRSLVSLLAFVLASPTGLAAEPTPTPGAKLKRKLGGGNFGLPPAFTPTPGDGGGASLAEAARKAQEESALEGQARPRGIVITNETLRHTGPTPPSASITITGKSGSKSRVKIPPTPTPTPRPVPEYRDASGRTEADWRNRASAARERAARAEAGVATAQAEVRRLENDFYAWSDGNYREGVIRPAWDQAKEKLKIQGAEADNARTALADLEDEARKSGAPPGWLR